MATTKKVKFYSVGAADCHVYGRVAELTGDRQGYLYVAATSQREAAMIVDRADGISGITAREFRPDLSPENDLVNNGFLTEAGDLIVEDLRHEKIVKVSGMSVRLVAVRHYDRNTRVRTLLVKREASQHDIGSLKYALERLGDPQQLLVDRCLVGSLQAWLQAALDDLTA